MAVEIGTAYVSIVASAKGIDKSIQGELGGIQTEADKTGGALDGMGKKVGVALAAGAVAIGAFAVKGVQQFQDLGIEVGKFSTTTGLSAEQSSRWIEVAGDLGIESSTLEGAIGKMNKAAGASPELFAKFGVEMVRTKDGALDVNATFLNTVDALKAMKDPRDRETAGIALLGRGWKDTAELVGAGSEQIGRDLAAVADNKIFTDQEVTEARGLREAFDKIGDSAGELQLSLGKNLAPAIVKVADVVVDVIDAVGPLVKLIGDGLVAAIELAEPLLSGLADVLGAVGDAAEWLGDTFGAQGAAVEDVGAAVGANAEKLQAAGYDLDDLAQSTVDGTISWEEFQKIVEGVDGSVYAAGQTIAKVATGMPALSDEVGIAELRTEDYNEAVVAAYEAQWEADASARAEAEALGLSQRAAQLARDEQNRLADSARRVEERVRDQMAAWDEITGRLDSEQAWLNLATQFNDMEQTIWDTQVAMNEGTTTVEQGMIDQAAAINTTKQAVFDYVTEIGGVPASKMTEYLAMIDEGKWNEVEQRLATLARNRTMELSIVAKGGTGSFANISLTGVRVFDNGGEMPGPRGVHQLAYVAGGETILPTHKYDLEDLWDPQRASKAGPLVGVMEVYPRGNDLDGINRALALARLQ